MILLPPTHLVPSILEIPYEELLDQGVTTFLHDVDLTLGEQGCTSLAPEIGDLLSGLGAKGVIVGLASNNTKDRSAMAQQFNGVALHAGFCRDEWVPRKPNPKFFWKILEILDSTPEESVMVGDKYFFDVLPALHIGMKAVLVNPCGPDLIGDQLMQIRNFENWALSRRGLARPTLA